MQHRRRVAARSAAGHRPASGRGPGRAPRPGSAAASGQGRVARSSPRPSPRPRAVTSASRSAFSRRRSAAAGSAAISSRPDQRAQPADRQLRGLGQHRRLDGGEHVVGGLAGRPAQLGGDRPGPRPVQPAVGQGRPGAPAAGVAGWPTAPTGAVAAAREQFSVRASSSAKNSEVSSSSCPAAHAVEAAPTCPRRRSSRAGRSSASPTTSSALNAASADSTCSICCSWAAFCCPVINATGSRSPSRDGRAVHPGRQPDLGRGRGRQFGDGHTDTERLRREHACTLGPGTDTFRPVDLQLRRRLRSRGPSRARGVGQDPGEAGRTPQERDSCT